MAASYLTGHHGAASFLAVADPFLRSAEVENSVIAAPAVQMSAAPHDDDTGSYFATVELVPPPA